MGANVLGREAWANSPDPRPLVSAYCAGTAAERLVAISIPDLRTAIM